MSLKRLAIRTKKSLSGLHAFSSDSPRQNAQQSPPGSMPETPKKNIIAVNENSPPSTDELFMSPASSGTDSPSKSSKRDKFKNSLRRIKSSLGSPKNKSSDDPVFDTQPATPVRTHASLTLNFEASPPDQPMFVPGRTSSMHSGMDVPRSSPIAVPDMGQRETPPVMMPYPTNTVPKSPAPLAKACAHSSIMRHSLSHGKTTMPCMSAFEPPLTPTPGANLTLADIQPPEILVSSPSNNTFTNQSGYFDIPASRPVDVPQRSIDVMVGSSLAGEETGKKMSDNAWAKIDVDMQMRKRTGFVHRRTAGSDHSSTQDATESSFSLDPEVRRSLESKQDFVNAYLARDEAQDDGPLLQDFPPMHRRRGSGWGRHTGLYDGTGYAPSELEEPVSPTTESASKSEGSKSARSIHQKSDATTTEERSTNPTSTEGSISEELANKKESLQDIIRAYASAPEIDDAKLSPHAVSEIGRVLSGSVTNPHVTCDTMKGEVVEEVVASIRVMNRSLGG